MPKPVLTRKRSWIARFAVLAMVFSLLAVALPASAHSVAIDTSTSCPSSTPSAGFTDIGGFDATTQLAINCLFAFGITTGTSATTYSPNDTTTRWQMALFLIRQAADHGLTIPAAANQGYTDIGGFPQATQDAINQITQLGISKGTSTTTFSPTLGVSRWQMALFLYRLSLAAGVTFTNDSTHNEFTDIGGTLAEAQTAINALADAHIALGTGGSAFSPDLLLVRWQMALFLTRVLAADGVPPPSGTAVVVTPTAQATQATGTARTYTATVKNTDGTNYSGQVIIRLIDANADGTANGTTVATGVDIEAVDGAAIGGTPTTATTFAGVDGTVTFVVRHLGGAAADTVPQVIRDTDTDGVVDAGEAIGSGGAVFFTFVPPELGSGASVGPFMVCSTDKAEDFFVVDTSVDNDCSALLAAPVFNRVEYDDNDIYLGDAVSFTEFESALSAGDTVSAAPYASADADQSTFTLTDIVTALSVSSPSAPVTVDAASRTVAGSGNPGWEVVVYQDQPVANTYSGAVDPAVTGVVVIDPDGDWSVSVPLAQNTTNDFIVVQRSAGSSTTSAPAGGATTADPNVEDVPTITEGVAAGASFVSTTSTNGASAGILDPNDTITITFSEAVSGFGSGDTFAIQDPDLSTVTLTCGGNVSCSIDGTNTIVTITIVNVLVTSGGTAGIEGSFTINSVSGFTTTSNGAAISMTGDRTATGF